MNLKKALNFAYRCQRKLERELRKRGGGRDVALDALIYQTARSRSPSKDLALHWAQLAPWGEESQRQGLVPSWATDDEARAVIDAADRACAHEFDLLGSGPVHLGDKIDWHVDFKSGYRWDASVHHAKIRWGDLPEGVDIKVPWELSRCMHFASLALADWITGDARYYQEWKTQLRDWIDANPVAFGVNWTCAMDVAMRAVNWLNAVMLFQQRIAQDPDEEFFTTLCESLWHHGLHIERNLEWAGPGGSLPGNHFLADLTGLLAIGGFFKHTRRGRAWWNFASKQLEHEISRQVHPDGCNYETSTSYHRMVMEMFLWADTLAENIGKPFSRAYRGRLDRMADFVAAYTPPGGKAAQIGDNDSGRLLQAGIDDGSDHRYLIQGECGFGGRLNRLLLRGTMPTPAGKSSESGFPNGGFHFICDEGAWLGLRAGSFALGGAHAHCDQLAVLLTLGGEDFLVDRGTGIYTPDPAKRNRYRSTCQHNILMVNDWEQNPIHEARNSVFRLQDVTHATVTRWDPQQGIWEAAHYGYERLVPGMTCTRKVTKKPMLLTLTDRINALRAGDNITWHFHFAPGLDLELSGSQLVAKGDRASLSMGWGFIAEAEIIDVWHSPAYGVEVAAKALRLRRTALPNESEFSMHIRWSHL
jgi:hypothetical protein